MSVSAVAYFWLLKIVSSNLKRFAQIAFPCVAANLSGGLQKKKRIYYGHTPFIRQLQVDEIFNSGNSFTSGYKRTEIIDVLILGIVELSQLFLSRAGKGLRSSRSRSLFTTQTSCSSLTLFGVLMSRISQNLRQLLKALKRLVIIEFELSNKNETIPIGYMNHCELDLLEFEIVFTKALKYSNAFADDTNQQRFRAYLQLDKDLPQHNHETRRAMETSADQLFRLLSRSNFIPFSYVNCEL